MVAARLRDGTGGKSAKLFATLSAQARGRHQTCLPDGSHGQRWSPDSGWGREDQDTGAFWIIFSSPICMISANCCNPWSAVKLNLILIHFQTSRRDQAAALLELLLRKDNNTFVSFYNSLVKEAYDDLANLLYDDLPRMCPDAYKTSSFGDTPYGNNNKIQKIIIIIAEGSLYFCCYL